MRNFFLSFFAAAVLSAVQAAQAQVNDQQFADLMKKYINTDAGRSEVGKSMEKYFMERQQKEADEQQKQAKLDMENQFKNPVKVEVGNAPITGPASAKVTIIEFSDYQCPFCKRGNDTIEQVLKAYPNDVKVAFKHLPLPMHPQAKPASLAAAAAGKQGKFWEFHKALFEHQRELSPEFFAKTAQELGLNVDQWKKDMESAEIKKTVEDNMAEAEKLGINATPGFFVNGVAVKGAYPFEHFKTIIDRHLGKK